MKFTDVAKGVPAVLSCVLLAHGTGASAQPAATGESAQEALSSGAASLFDRNRSVSVRDRQHPEYAQAPHRAGSFDVTPTVQLTGEYNDNIDARPDKTSDAILDVAPRLDVASNWSRHALDLFARADLNRYASHSRENNDDWQVGGTGRLDIVRGSNIIVGGDAGRFTEERTSASTQGASVRPIRYNQESAFIAGVREVNRLRLSARADWRKFTYSNGIDPNGGVVFEKDRDHDTKSILGRADYAVSPATAVFVEAAANWRNYKLDPPAVFLRRDSEGEQVLGGVNLELTNLIRGEVALGYIDQRFKDPRFRPVRGLGYRGQLEWFPTLLTTVTLRALRSVEDSGVPDTSGYSLSTFSAQVDHELLRNLILSAQAQRSNDSYRGIDRRDRRTVLGASATYLMNRRMGWTLSYNHLTRSSEGLAAGQNYVVNQLLLGLTLHL